MSISLQPWSRRCMIFAVAAKHGIKVAYGLTKAIFTKGPWTVLSQQERSTPPAILNDPALGTHGYLKLKDVRLHYVANGPEDAPLMLFLHGFPEFWYSWRHQIQHFSSRYRCVAIDMRGYNDSDKPKGMKEYHISKLLDDVKQTIHALGYSKCILVAHDWGAGVAYAFANFYPELIHRMVILNGVHHFAYRDHLASSKTQYEKSWYVFFFQLPFLPELRIRADNYSYIKNIFTAQDANGLGAKKGTFSKDDVEAYKYAMSRPGATTSTVNYYRAGMQCKGPKYPTRDIRAPTLIIWGTGDKAINTELAELSGKYVNNCQVHYIPGASHWVPQECPDEVNRSIQAFLDQPHIPQGFSKL